MPYIYECDICHYLDSVLDKIEQSYVKGSVIIRAERWIMENVAEILSSLGFIVRYNPKKGEYLEVACQ